MAMTLITKLIRSEGNNYTVQSLNTGTSKSFASKQEMLQHNAQIEDQPIARYIVSPKGYPQLIYGDYKFYKECVTSTKVHWRCSFYTQKCKVRLYSSGDSTELISNMEQHNHASLYSHPIKRRSFKTKKKLLKNRKSRGNETRDKKPTLPTFQFIESQRGAPQLLYQSYKFNQASICNNKIIWRCSSMSSKCRVYVYSSPVTAEIVTNSEIHNHEPPTLRKKFRVLKKSLFTRL